MVRPADIARPVIVDFGRQLKTYRLNAKLTQPQLAARACMKRLFIGQLELGKSNPSLATIALLAHALGRDVADFFPRKADANGLESDR